MKQKWLSILSIIFIFKKNNINKLSNNADIFLCYIYLIKIVPIIF